LFVLLFGMECAEAQALFSGAHEDLPRCVRADRASLMSIEADLDANAVRRVEGYYVESPPFLIPVSDLLANLRPEAAHQRFSPAAAGGWFLLLRPLAPGLHTLHFQGTDATFALDVTYRLVVE